MPRVPPGRKGPSGQTLVPVLGVVAHGERRLLKIISVEPTAAVGQYLTADGVTDDPDDAVDVRGQPGVVTTEQEVVVVPGKPGDPGAAATIEVGEVEQLPAGSMPTVDNVGDRNAARLNFGIPAPEAPKQPADPRQIELQNTGEAIQWRYTDGQWQTLALVSDLKGKDGIGKNGDPGKDASEVELQNNGTQIQWRYVGGTWKTLTELSALKGEPGQSIKGDPGLNGVSPAISGVSVTMLAPGEQPKATISGAQTDLKIALSIPAAKDGTNGTDATAAPSAPTAKTYAFNTAYQPSTTKPTLLSASVSAAYNVTLASAMTDSVQLIVGPTNAVASGTGVVVAEFVAGLTGIAVSIGMGATIPGHLFAAIPAGYFFALVKPAASTRVKINSATIQTMG